MRHGVWSPSQKFHLHLRWQQKSIYLSCLLRLPLDQISCIQKLLASLGCMQSKLIQFYKLELRFVSLTLHFSSSHESLSLALSHTVYIVGTLLYSYNKYLSRTEFYPIYSILIVQAVILKMMKSGIPSMFTQTYIILTSECV